MRILVTGRVESDHERLAELADDDSHIVACDPAEARELAEAAPDEGFVLIMAKAPRDVREARFVTRHARPASESLAEFETIETAESAVFDAMEDDDTEWAMPPNVVATLLVGTEGGDHELAESAQHLRGLVSLQRRVLAMLRLGMRVQEIERLTVRDDQRQVDLEVSHDVYATYATLDGDAYVIVTQGVLGDARVTDDDIVAALRDET